MDVTAPINPLSRDRLLSSIRRFDLVSDEALGALEREFPEAGGLQFSQILINNKLLTHFQLQLISDGKASSLQMGNYDLLDRLGVGGMGTVYKARHRRMKRLVALKILQQKLGHDPTFVLRFQREVETIARLGHPNIVMAYDADVCEGGHFLVMELIDGKDLSTIVHRLGVFTVNEALDLIRQAARGLAYAHQQHVIHRDIKPANLLRNREGTLKVTDLGLARLVADQERQTIDSAITQAGFAMGTPDYMSPEQAFDGNDIDGRADIYSLGATFYYLLVGHPMYRSQSPMSTVLQHREAAIPKLRESIKEIPEAVELLYLRMVQKCADERFQKMDEIVDAINSILDSHSKDAESSSYKFRDAPPSIPSTPTLLPGTAIPQPPTVAIATNLETPAELPLNFLEALNYLVVEPSRVQAAIMRRYLESYGATKIEIASNGKNAFRFSNADAYPDVVISAKHIPDMEVRQVIAQFANQNTRKSPIFVLVTSELEPQTEASDSSATSSMVSYTTLLKPFTAAQLRETLLDRLERRNRTEFSLDFSVDVPIDSIRNTPRSRPSRKNCTVLLVDDSPTARTFERMTLEKLGFEHFAEAQDGAQAIAAATQANFDLIITDYNMPLMNGRALVSYLKQNPATRLVPIIMVTSEKDQQLEKEILELGVEVVMDKSFLATEVEQWANRLFPNK